jgi:hypothetical protein
LFIPAKLEAWVYIYSDGVFLRHFQRGFTGCVT